MKSLRIMWMAAALLILVSGPNGCAIPDELTRESEAAAALDPAGADSGAAAEDATTLEGVAAALVSRDAGSDVAWSSGYSSVSISNDYSPPPDDSTSGNTSSPGDSGGGDSSVAADSGVGTDSGDSGGSGATDESGESDDSVERLPEEPCEHFYPERCYICPDWGGDYVGTIYCDRTGTFQGSGGDSSYEMKFCSVSMSFDEAGVPEWIPIPIFARSMTRVYVSSPGETKVYSFWVYRMTITVVSATYTPTTADVVLDIDLSWFGDDASIWAVGVHTMHTEIVGDSVEYSSLTRYEGGFFASGGDPDNPGEDWHANATADYDGTATLRKP